MIKAFWILFLFSGVLIAKMEAYKNYFKEAGAHYNIPPLLLEKIATIESGGYHSKTHVYRDRWLKKLIVALKTSP